MVLTNKTNLPQPIVALATKLLGSHPKMENNEFSVTELEKGIKELVLSRRHADEIEFDIQDSYNLWGGTLVHQMLESFSDDYEVLTEKRFKIDLGEFDPEMAGVIVSGSLDLFENDTEIIWDYKNTKVAQYVKSLSLKDKKFFYQLMFYKLLAEKYGYKVKGLKIVAMLKDHSKIKASLESSYPQNPINVIDYSYLIGPTTIKEVIEYFINKAKQAMYAMCMKDDDIPPCTPEERMEDIRYSIQKVGAKRATKNFDTYEEAQANLASYGEGYEIVKKGDKPIKCLNYCSCCKFCNFYKEHCLGGNV